MTSSEPISPREALPITKEEVRRAVGKVIGDEGVAKLGPHDSLIRSGIISSLDIVSVAAELESHFGIRISDQDITIANFDSLASLTHLVARQGGGEVEVASGEPKRSGILLNGVSTLVARPIAAVVMLLCSLVIMDLMLSAVMSRPLAAAYRTFMENGQRLYPVSGGYANDDLAFAVARHRIGDAASTKTAIAVFGDSGTIGSWVHPEEAIPAQVETALRSRQIDATVTNLAFFMQFIAKDLMIFEAVLEKTNGTIPFQTAVFTLGDAYFSRSMLTGLPKVMPYLSLNRNLLDRFAKRVDPRGRQAFDSLTDALASSAGNIRTPPEEWLALHSALYHYAPFFRYYVNTIPLLKLPNLNYNFEGQYSLGRRPLYAPVPANPPAGFDVSLGLAPGDFDSRAVAMLDSAIDYLRAHKIPVLLYLKPHGPKEWMSLYKQPEGAVTVSDVAQRLCEGGRCKVVDLRWEISGSEFTDSLAHYTPEANARIGKHIADVLAGMLSQ